LKPSSLHKKFAYIDEIIDTKTKFSIFILFQLLGRGHIYLQLAEKLIIKAIKYQFYFDAAQLAHKILTFYTFNKVDKSKQLKYKKIMNTCLEEAYWETKINVEYMEIASMFEFSKNIDKDLFDLKINEAMQVYEPVQTKIQSQLFRKDFINLKMMKYHVHRRFEEVVKLSDELLDYLNEQDFKSTMVIKATLRKKADHLILLKKFDLALETINQLINMEVVGSVTWASMQFNLLKIYINQEEFQKAYQVILDYKNVKGNVYTNKFFNIYKVFFQAFIKMGLINGEQYIRTELRSLELSNEDFKKDKSGMNTTILISQICIAIAEKDNSAMDKIDALKMYSFRYLTKRNIRTKIFLNMIMEVLKYNFHPIAIERNTQKHLKKLEQNPAEITDEAVEIELIPYEKLWKIIMEFIKKKRGSLS
jgi:hypothetical protein